MKKDSSVVVVGRVKFEEALSRLRHQMNASKILRLLKQRRYFIKPSEQNKLKRYQAERRRQRLRG